MSFKLVYTVISCRAAKLSSAGCIYILERLSLEAPREYIHPGLVLRLDLASCQLSSILYLPCLPVAAGPLWGSARELSLSPLTWQGDPPPTPGPGEGGVTTPSYWSIADTTVASLLRGTGGFNHLSESLNPFNHTRGPRRGRSFRRRLRQ